MKIDVRTNIDQLSRSIERDMRKVVSRASVNAINHVANGVRADVRTAMKSAFDRPTTYTLNSLYVSPAKSENLTARVWFKDRYSADPDQTGRHFLVPQIFGGQRVEKRFEWMLKRVGVLPKDMIAVPGNDAKRDANGNMSRGEIIQILSWARALQVVAGATQNMTNETFKKRLKGSRNKKGFKYVLVREKRGGLMPGIWRADYGGLGRSIRPVLMFVTPGKYKSRLKFFDIAESSISRRFSSAWDKAYQEQIRRVLL